MGQERKTGNQATRGTTGTCKILIRKVLIQSFHAAVPGESEAMLVPENQSTAMHRALKLVAAHRRITGSAEQDSLHR